MLHELELSTPSAEHEGVRGYCVPPSPLCCEFHQNGAIMGGRRKEEASILCGIVTLCDNVSRVENMRSRQWSRLPPSGSEARPSKPEPVTLDFGLE